MGRSPFQNDNLFRNPDTCYKNSSNHYCNKSTKESLKVCSVSQPCRCNDII